MPVFCYIIEYITIRAVSKFYVTISILKAINLQ